MAQPTQCESSKRIAITLAAEVAEEIKLRAKSHSLSVTKYCRAVFREWLRSDMELIWEDFMPILGSSDQEIQEVLSSYPTPSALTLTSRQIKAYTNFNHILEDQNRSWVGGEYKGLNSEVIIRCNVCDSEESQNVSALLSNKTPCQNCRKKAVTSPERIKANLNKFGFEWVSGKVDTLTSKITIRCLTCGAEKCLQSVQIIYHNLNCSACNPKLTAARKLKMEKLKKGLEKKGLELIGGEYRSLASQLQVKCITCGSSGERMARNIIDPSKPSPCITCRDLAEHRKNNM